ncbi:N-acetyltransferase [Flammeovirga pectinis]|uniref:N-acetyltransferase n=1 Tax=Flammeovirga pectinis TaxID=2494373 RepID=A0A3S9P4I8_9BACT|nr:GNAT family N-acetyltransferase [Flammeovirga pectinis]AZQ63068.1 N-acetyltransferase [Flammeovirga pectinis]
MEWNDFTINIQSELSEFDKETICKLWNKEYPMQLAFENTDALDVYLNNLESKQHILVKNYGNQIVGWFFCFEREGQTWFATIVNSFYQHQRIGSKLLALGKQNFGSLNGWVIDHDRYYKSDGKKYLSPINFYLRNGFKIDNDRLELPTLSAVKISSF